jgi:hypothetical protein
MNVIARYIESYGGIFRPDDLTLLQKLFDEVCLREGYPTDGEDAEYLALLIVTLFRSGIVDEDSLRKAVDVDGGST